MYISIYLIIYLDDDSDIVGDDWMKAPLVFETDGPVLAKDASTKVCDFGIFIQIFQFLLVLDIIKPN